MTNQARLDAANLEIGRLRVEARRLANRAKVWWVAVQTLAELHRTEESSRRAEMRFTQQGGAG